MKSKTKTGVRKVKGWAIVFSEFENNGYSDIPQVGNGKQWQFPIFPTKREAKEFKEEPHGLEGGRIVPCTITYHLAKQK